MLRFPPIPNKAQVVVALEQLHSVVAHTQRQEGAMLRKPYVEQMLVTQVCCTDERVGEWHTAPLASNVVPPTSLGTFHT